MTIVKNNMLFVLIYLVLQVNSIWAACNEFEPASQFYQDKVHEFLGYLGVENAADIGVYKIDSQSGEKRDYLINYGHVPGIWINEDMWLDNSYIRTEQDVIWRLAMAAVNYTSDLNQVLLQLGGIWICAVTPIVMSNVFLTLLARSSYAKHYSLLAKILVGSVANIGAIAAAVGLNKYLMEKIFLPNVYEHLKKDSATMVQILCEHGYQNAAQAYIDYAEKYLN